MQHDLALRGQVVGDERRQADAEVHVRAFGNVARDAGGHLLAREPAHGAHPAAARRASACGPVTTTRRTKMPGVTMHSGSSVPSGTISRTSAIVQRAADAITGPKLRAVLR